MTTTAEKIEIMQAFEDGVEIEYKFKKEEEWILFRTKEPTWNWWDYEWRIKPKAKRKLYLWYYQSNSSSGWDSTLVPYESEEDLRECQRIGADREVIRRDETMVEVPQ